MGSCIWAQDASEFLQNNLCFVIPHADIQHPQYVGCASEILSAGGMKREQTNICCIFQCIIKDILQLQMNKKC